MATHALNGTQASHPAAPPLDLNGTYWLPPPRSGHRTEGNVSFTLAGNGTLRATLRSGSTLTPIPTSDIQVQLLAPNGTAMAAAGFAPLDASSNPVILECSRCAQGTYSLRIAAWGGSDGSAHGDYLAYTIQGRPSTDPA